MSRLEEVQALAAAIGSLVETSKKAADEVEQSTKRIVEATRRQSESLTQGLRQIQEMAESGNQWAQQAEGIAQSVKEGLAPAGAAIHAFGDGLAQLEGKSRTVRDWLSHMGLGQAATDLRELIAQTTSYAERLEILSTLHGEQAQMVKRLLDAYAAGNATLDEVLEKLGEAKRAQGALGDLAEGLYNDLKNGKRQGKW